MRKVWETVQNVGSNIGNTLKPWGRRTIEYAEKNPMVAGGTIIAAPLALGAVGGAMSGGDSSDMPIMIEADPLGYEVSVPELSAEDLKRQIDYYNKRIGTDHLTLQTLQDRYSMMGG